MSAKIADACKCSTVISYMNSEYEEIAAPHKKKLFLNLFPEIHHSPPFTVVELGIGLFSNAPYYPSTVKLHLNILGIKPDVQRHALAMAAAEKNGLHLRIINCCAEELPFEDCSIDTVVNTNTLCTVQDPARALQEVKRVLKPGCRLLFWEQVLSETDTEVARLQAEKSDEEFRQWGCSFDKHSLKEIRKAGFAQIFGVFDEECYFELPGLELMGPTAAGVATRELHEMYTQN